MRAAAALAACLLAAGSPLSAAPGEETARFSFAPEASGAIERLGYYRVWQAPMSTTRPGCVTKEPAYRSAPLYTEVQLGDRAGRRVTFALDEDDEDARFYVDANANGDLTDDPVPPASRRITPEERRHVVKIWRYYDFRTTATADYAGGAALPVALRFYIYSRADRERNRIEPVLLYYRDYCRTGTLVLGGKAYRAALVDDNTDGRYNSDPVAAVRFPGDTLLIDTDLSGKFERTQEGYSLREPFNVDGVTYEVAEVAADGSALALRRSARQVPPRAAPRGPRVGDAPPEIAGTAVDGRKVSLAALKGKVVLVDFWATWCGPCVEEMPAVRALYDRYHDGGLEIVGVALDDPKDREKVVAFARDLKLPWPQLHDTRSEFARAYGVAAIPYTVLIGKDGRVLATRLRGRALDSAVEAALK